MDATRASLLNGIEDFVARADLADRCIFIQLTPITDNERRDEAELDAGFESARPAILGALLDAVAHGLREWPRTRLKAKPRMADFARWATACEGAMFAPGSFEDAYRRNRKAAVDDVIEADMVADAVRTFMRKHEDWSGTAAWADERTPPTTCASRYATSTKISRPTAPASPAALRGLAGVGSTVHTRTGRARKALKTNGRPSSSRVVPRLALQRVLSPVLPFAARLRPATYTVRTSTRS